MLEIQSSVPVDASVAAKKTLAPIVMPASGVELGFWGAVRMSLTR
jgi:hypothetical protein